MKDGDQGSEVILFKELENGFKLLFESDKHWEKLIKDVEKTVSSFNYLFNQYQYALRYEEDSEISKDFPLLKESLISKIHDKIGEEMKILADTVCECKRLSENLIIKRDETTSLLSRSNDASKQILKGVSTFTDGVNSLEILYVDMLVAFHKAKSLEAAIPKSSFSYSSQQRQKMDRLEEIWLFYQASFQESIMKAG